MHIGRVGHTSSLISSHFELDGNLMNDKVIPYTKDKHVHNLAKMIKWKQSYDELFHNHMTSYSKVEYHNS